MIMCWHLNHGEIGRVVPLKLPLTKREARSAKTTAVLKP